jgi:hypothetical protein
LLLLWLWPLLLLLLLLLKHPPPKNIVILSEVARSTIASYAVEGPALAPKAAPFHHRPEASAYKTPTTIPPKI